MNNNKTNKSTDMKLAIIIVAFTVACLLYVSVISMFSINRVFGLHFVGISTQALIITMLIVYIKTIIRKYNLLLEEEDKSHTA